MRYPQIIVVMTCLFSWACIDLPEVQQVPETSDSGEPGGHAEDSGTSTDASVPDSGVPDSGIVDSGTPTLAVTLETSRSITNGDVQVSAQVTGPVPDQVELLADGVAVAALAPPYELRWSAQSLEEGAHVLSVRATLGDRSFTSESRPLVVDRTPPRLLSQLPLTGSQRVSVRETIQATFSEPLEPATVSAESAMLMSDAGVVAADVSLSSEGTLLTLHPVSPLSADTTVQVSLGSLMDLAGNTLQALPQDWEWRVPGYLPLGGPLSASSTESAMVQSPSLRIDGSGRPVVAWLEGTEMEPYGVRVVRWNGTSWEQLGAVLTISAGSISSVCSLMVDGAGRLLVVWDEYSASAGMSIRVRRWNGSTWEPLGSSGALLPQQGGADFIVFEGNKQGQIAMAFRELSQDGKPLSVWRWDGSNWVRLGTPLKVDSSRFISSYRMALDAAGNPLVAWSESDSTGNIAAYMRRWNGSAWVSISLPAQTYVVALIVDGSGAPIVKTAFWDGAGRRAQLWRWSGSSWETLGNPISSYPGATDTDVAALTLDAQGRLIALFAEPEVAGGPSVFYFRRWNAEVWESVGNFLRKYPGSTPVGATLLALDVSDQPVLARSEDSESDPNRRRVYVYTPND